MTHEREPQPRPSLVTVALLALFVWLAVLALRGPRSRTPTRPGGEAASDRPPAADAKPVNPTAPTGAVAHAELGAEERNAIAIYRAVSPSVVSVANRALVRGGLFGFQIYEVPQGSGSGFVWDRKGHIISNYHVIHQASAVTVTFPDGTSYDATLVGVSPDHDLAVLRIDAPPDKLVAVRVGTSKGLQVGQSVLAIGNPFGLDTTLTVGIVSALGRSITSMTERRISDVIQTDAAINPGNSGGPLLDSSGALIGINTAILSPSGAYAGIGFAVPVDTVSRVVPQLIEKGRVSRVALGVQLLPDHVTRRAGVEGAAILATAPGGPADQAGLRGVSRTRDGNLALGDIITAVEGKAVRGSEDLGAALDPFQPGDAVSVAYRRNGSEARVTVRLQEAD